MIIHNEHLKQFVKQEYTPADVDRIWQLLLEKKSLEFNTVPGRGLFMAAASTDETTYTGYENVWVRDNIHVAHCFYVQGKQDAAVKTVQDIASFWIKYINRWHSCIQGTADYKNNVMERPHIRFNGTDLKENEQQWSHAQNDAIGYFLWLYCKLAQENRLEPNLELLGLITLYYRKIEFWSDADNGHWEEARKVEASSIGTALAGLRELKTLLDQKALSRFEAEVSKINTTLSLNRTESGLDTLLYLQKKGKEALDYILPYESRDPGQERSTDAALLFLVYPLQIVTGEMAQKIVDDVARDLQGEHGIRRYRGDSYWMADYKTIFNEESRTADFSEDIGARDRHFKEGTEAQWCIYDSIISCYYGQKYLELANAGASAAAEAARKKQVEYFNRAVGQITGDDCKFGAFKCPESYYIENGKYVSNDICPLLWTQANIINAFIWMKKSPEPKKEVSAPLVVDNRLKNYFNAALLALPWLGVQTIWATEFGVLVQTLQGYGLSQSVASLAWIFGPITGFFVAPLIGVFSDNNTSKYGRRRPYIIAGLLSTVVCSLLFAFSESLGATKEAHLAVGFFSFVGLDITINIMQTPLRALGSDLAPLGFQEAVQLFAALFQGLGGILGSVIMKAFYTGYANELPKVFLTVMAINLSLITFICLVVKEEQYVPKAGQDKPTAAKAIFGAFSGIAKMDKKMAIICAIEFFSWAALFAWWPSASTWWAVNVYGGCRANNTDCLEGSVGEKAYRDGNTAYGDSGIYANLVQTFLSLLLSVALSFGLLKQVKIPYAFCLLVGAAMLILSKIGPQTVFVGYLVAILVAVPIAAIQSFPFAIVGNYNKGKPENETGLQMGILNIFICLPQIIITFVVTALSETYGVQGIPWTLFAGGFCFGIAGILALFIQGADASEIKHSLESGLIKDPK